MKYTRRDLGGKILTVCGPVEPQQLGVTHTHEHLVLDISVLFTEEPAEEEARRIFHAPLSLEILPYVRYGFDNLDMYRQTDAELAIRELEAFKTSGGRSIVDVTPVEIGRNPDALRHISQATGLNVVMGCGHYVESVQERYGDVGQSTDYLAAEVTSDVLQGVDDSDIHSGIIGEVGCSWPLRECERRMVQAAATAQRATGVVVTIHPGRHKEAPFEIMDVFEKAGGDVTKVIMCHLDRTFFDWESLPELLSLAESGCYLEWDLFGLEPYYPESIEEGEPIDIPNDTGRIRFIKEMFARGFGSRILVSHDIDQKFRLMAWGGHGYGHILRNVVPAMKRRGMSGEQIDALLIDNPRDALTIA